MIFLTNNSEIRNRVFYVSPVESIQVQMSLCTGDKISGKVAHAIHPYIKFLDFIYNILSC
jgi:hypothetical protein